jgi:hypothetical protein
VKTWSRQLTFKRWEVARVSDLDSNVGNPSNAESFAQLLSSYKILRNHHSDRKNHINTTAFEREHCALQFPTITSAVS